MKDDGIKQRRTTMQHFTECDYMKVSTKRMYEQTRKQRDSTR